MKRLTAAAAAIMTLQGCTWLTRPDNVVAHPDAPMLVTDISGDCARVSAYSRSRNEMIDIGWVDMHTVTGWTLTKYDWEKHIGDAAAPETP